VRALNDCFYDTICFEWSFTAIFVNSLFQRERVEARIEKAQMMTAQGITGVSGDL